MFEIGGVILRKDESDIILQSYIIIKNVHNIKDYAMRCNKYILITNKENNEVLNVCKILQKINNKKLIICDIYDNQDITYYDIDEIFNKYNVYKIKISFFGNQ